MRFFIIHGMLGHKGLVPSSATEATNPELSSANIFIIYISSNPSIVIFL